MRNRYPIITLVLLFCFTELIINPIGNFPLNDDWWYAHLYKKLFEDLNPDKIAWASTSLWGQLLLTKVFSYVFGYSYTALRFFTLILSLLSVVFFYKTCLHLQITKKAAFILSIALFFNPLFLCLSNSYMTDIPFIFFISGAIYYFLNYSKTKTSWSFTLSTILFTFAILTRQVALAFLIGILITEFFLNKKLAYQYLILAIIPTAALFVFELWLQTKVNNNIYTYAFFHHLSIQNKIPLTNALVNFSKRWLHYITVSGFTLFPLIIPYLIHAFKNKKLALNLQLLMTCLLFIPVVISLFKFPIGNYLYNIGVGPETLFDVYVLQTNTASLQSSIIFWAVKLIAFIGSFGLLFLFIKIVFGFRKSNYKQNHAIIFFAASLFFYYSFLCLSSAIFDRYVLVFTLFSLFLIYHEISDVLFNNRITIALLILMGIFSTLSTKDYLQGHRSKWEIVSLIKSKYKVGDKEINAGYEHEGSCFADSLFWYEKWLNLPPNNYLISRGPVKNYNLLGFRVFQGYVPFKKDTLFYLKYQGNTAK